MSESSTITVTFINNAGFIFNGQDYMTLRKTYRIIGNLVGSSLISSRNFSHKGLPVLLSHLELQLLLEKNIISLLSKKGLSAQPTEEQQLQFKNFQSSHLAGQHEVLRDNKLNESRKYIGDIMRGKEKKLLKAGVKKEDIHLNEEDVLKDIRDSYDFSDDNALIQIPTEHPFDVESERITLTADSTFKYRVFKDLWERGGTITSGESFGGDFLVYPGDPLYFHASHIVHVVESSNISPVTMMSCGRLAVNVNKQCLFAVLDVDRDEICYLNMSWEGNKSARLMENKGIENS
ncbi:tRNA-splicing endonuclease subunit Sen34 [Bradysia coprophila]|uniref:tRNA-splicing endonuclease subunit Sen34 n=1 Tax=Bradysia coprophila TaxID=38358 RepID=UPI00187DC02D|nr:tRNA-splicing endonuclease subunit Sen34 [Bradysia coprophila]